MRSLIPARAIHKFWKHVVDAARNGGCLIVGHEASGIVLEVGDGVTRASLGIALHFHDQGLDLKQAEVLMTGMGKRSMLVRYDLQRHTVVSENRVTVLPDGLEMTQAILLGCALPTGMGSVLNVGTN